jgi:hypothetical protein
MNAQQNETAKTYHAPSLTSHGDLVAVTLGDNPITPPEAVDLQGFDESI